MLNDYTADVISQYANECCIQIDIEHERIVIPNDKPKGKAILGFLDEQAYNGPLCQDTYLANTKRQIDGLVKYNKRRNKRGNPTMVPALYFSYAWNSEPN